MTHTFRSLAKIICILSTIILLIISCNIGFEIYRKKQFAIQKNTILQQIKDRKETFIKQNCLTLSTAQKSTPDLSSVSIISPQSSPQQDPYLYLLQETLKSELQKNNLTVTIRPTVCPQQNEIYLVISKTFVQPAAQHKNIAFLYAGESPISLPKENIKNSIPFFNTVWTHQESLVNNKNVLFTAIAYSFDDIDWTLFNTPFEKRPVFTMQIASGGWQNSFPKNIYYLRHDIVRWFIQNQPTQLHLYGNRWEDFKSSLSITEQNVFEKIHRGYIENKIVAFSQAKFAFTYENSIENGYVTEKIFDAMKAGTIPIYLGAPDIEKYIPSNCFINAADFKSLDELYSHLQSITPEQYAVYQQNMRAFIENFHTTPFYYKTVVKNIVERILTQTKKTAQHTAAR